MEVHVSNVPMQTSASALKNALRPYLNSLSIQSVYYQNRYGDKYATLTFLYSQDAEKFLLHHGQLKDSRHGMRPRPISSLYVQLYLHYQLIYFQKSYREPTSFTLRGLAKEAADRNLRSIDSSGPRQNSAKILPISFDTCSVSCGAWAHDNSEFVLNNQFTSEENGTAKFGERSMILTLDSGKRLDFRYWAVDFIIADDGGSASFMLSMLEPPRIFEKVINPVADIFSMLNLRDQLSNLPKIRKGVERHRLPYLNADHKAIVGHCLVYRIGLTKSAAGTGAQLASKMQNLNKATELPNIKFYQTKAIAVGVPYTIGFESLRLPMSSLNSALPFEVAFQVQKLAQNNYLPPETVLNLLPGIAEILDRSGVLVTANAIRKLFREIPWPTPDEEQHIFRANELLIVLQHHELQFNQGEFPIESAIFPSGSKNIAIIHRVKVTPTTFTLSGPEPETNNRVLRKYPDHHSHFLRVQFCEEDGGKVSFSPKVSNYKIFYERFKTILQDGIDIAGRNFSFLGFSHSSLRMQTCWFVAPFVYEGELRDDRNIIHDLGDFSLFRSPAKCAARIGQAFSDTSLAVAIDDCHVTEIRDVEANDRVFSDGVGTMSKPVMEMLRENLPAKRFGKPTSFQIRYKGAKGMIVFDSRLSGKALNLRPSMIKFTGSNSNDIEICEASYKALPVKLNRQFIKILEDLGVEDSFFLDLQDKEVRNLRMITESPINASNFIKRQSIGEFIHLPWLINKLAALNLDFRKDGFLRDVMEVALLVELRLLKHKTRIPVEKGWQLHGLMDETNFLEEGQIFCTAIVDGKARILVGKDLVVTRAPALHPGDVQLAEGVEPPIGSPLLKLNNCICFSQKGARDLPSMLSGGDLDGDRYFVIWDANARPKVTYHPADYPRQKPVNIGRSVTKSDMTDFFVKFMETDQLGRIAVLHRVLSDQRDTGTLDGDCITLAGMHSTAVDFSKTGIPVDLSLLPKVNSWRPDFETPGPHVTIERANGLSFSDENNRDPDDAQDDADDDFSTFRYYESHKVLGKLFRAIDERAIFANIQSRSWAEGITSSSTVIDAVWKHVQVACPVIQWRHKLEWARGIREMYEDCISFLMIEYTDHPTRPLSELEAFVGNILGKTGVPNKQQGNLATSIKEKFQVDCAYVVDCILKKGSEWSEEALENSMACLAVSLEDHVTFRRKEQLLSFKYVAAAVCLREVDRLPILEKGPYDINMSRKVAN